jgi:hypothetical protein
MHEAPVARQQTRVTRTHPSTDETVPAAEAKRHGAPETSVAPHVQAARRSDPAAVTADRPETGGQRRASH